MPVIDKLISTAFSNGDEQVGKHHFPLYNWLYWGLLTRLLCFPHTHCTVRVLVFVFYIDLSTRCKDLVSGVAYNLIVAFLKITISHFNSYFPAFKQIQQYIVD